MIIRTRKENRHAYCTFYVGQSNGTGQPQTGDPLNRTLLGLPIEYQGYQPKVRLWNRTLDSLEAGDDFEVQDVHDNTQHWGTEIGLLHKAADFFGRSQYVAKFTVSGAGISYFSPSVPGDIWPNLEIGVGNVVDWFADKGYASVSYRVIWMQGESDCTAITGHSTDYEGDLREFIDAFRAIRPELSAVPFVFSKIIPAQTGFYPTSTPVNGAFDTLVAEDPTLYYTFSSTDFGTMACPDGTHYNGESLFAFGQGLFDYLITNNLFAL